MSSQNDNIEPELKEKLISLFHNRPDLFEEIDLGKYNLDDGEGWEEILRDGESALIEIEGRDYRFGLDEVSVYVGDDVYDI